MTGSFFDWHSEPMKIIIAKAVVFLIFLFGFQRLQAQVSVITAGGNAAGNDGTAGFSVGQVVYSTNATGKSAVMEGVQQPYEILFMEGLAPGLGTSLECNVYPNPVIKDIIVKLDHNQIDNPGYQVYGMEGLLLREGEIMSNETCIRMNGLPPATYFLTLLSKGVPLRTYKIIKK